MTGRPPAPSGGPPGGGRVPDWMRCKDDMGQNIALVLRCKVEADDTEETATIRYPRLPEPFTISASIELTIGVKEARTVIASREGRGSRYILRTSSKSIVDKLTKMTKLVDDTQIEIFLHPTLNTIQGIVYEPDSINTEEKIIEEKLASQNVQAVRRIKKRVNGKLQNTSLLVLTFHGTALPSHVYFGMLRIPVRPYYPSPLLCFNCGTYGHPRKSCQEPGRCMRCSQPLHVDEGQQCENTPHCFHCKNGHAVTSRECPKFKEEDKIIHLKVDQCISFTEARRLYTEENKKDTIARMIQDQLKQELAAKDQMIASLQKQVATLARELASLKSAIKSRSHSQSSTPQDTQPASTQQSLLAQPSPSTLTSHTGVTSKTDTRESRKDKAFISPAPKTKDNLDIESKIHTRSRSRSGKRSIEVSPTDSINTRGKRKSNLAGASSNTVNIDE